jgi:hypothetical protein
MGRDRFEPRYRKLLDIIERSFEGGVSEEETDHVLEFISDALYYEHQELDLPFLYEFIETLLRYVDTHPDKAIDYAVRSGLGGKFVSELINRGKLSKRLIQEASKDPAKSYLLAQRLEQYGVEVPTELIQSISQSPKYSYRFAEELSESGKDIPNELIQSISKIPAGSYEIAVKLLESGKEIPNELIQGAAQSPLSAFKLAIKLLKSGKDIPNELIQSISQDPYYSYYFSEYLNFDKSRIPSEIQESAKKWRGYQGEFEKQSSLSVRSKWLK